jgi:alkylation response protein AidB-like acyl-CoA dehydrogenase
VLVADIATPGITVRPFPTLGGGSLCEVFLEGVEIPREQLVGELHGGWQVLMHTLDFERITAEKLGGVLWILDELEAHVGTSRQLAHLRGELEAARLLSFRAAWLIDRGEPAAAASAMAKLAGARVTQRVADAAVDLLGLQGLADGEAGSPVEGRVGSLYRAAVGSTISGGSAEIQQLVIARQGLSL